MTDLIEEVKLSFERVRPNADGPLTVVTSADETELAPGFQPMQAYFQDRLLMVTRRGYRHFAGSTMPTNGNELVQRTIPTMVSMMIATSLGAFADGVMVGQQIDQTVKMCIHFNALDHLWHDQGFRATSLTMAHGFAEVDEVSSYFHTYVETAIAYISHVTGFAHSEVDPGKVWDLWMMAGASCVCTSYLAGNQLGTTWRERDVLDGIEAATEEGSRGPQGEG